MTTITLNNEKRGIEIRFDGKPESGILELLKQNGFRFSRKQMMWYAKQSAEALVFAESIGKLQPSMAEKSNQNNYDLWEKTRTEKIENNEKYRIYDTKEIAQIVRKHLKENFPMCEWSVRSDRNSINVNLLASPFAIDSDELNAIVHYAYTFTQSYNYDNSDIMSDYFDVNFYGAYESDIVKSYRYEQRESTEMEKIISEDFKKNKQDFDAAEAERLEQQAIEAEKQRAIEKAEMEKRNAIREAEHDEIEKSYTEKSVDYFVLNVYSPSLNKCDTIQEIESDRKGYRKNCRVTREIYFIKSVYGKFANQLLSDFTFLSGMGGSSTNDKRINSMTDYYNMEKSERETVEWFCDNCVAIFCDNELKLVIDPQGYSYARYTFIVDNQSKKVKEYSAACGISEKEHAENLSKAELLEDASASIIEENNLLETWNTENFNLYKTLIKEWIYKNKFKLNKGVVQAIETENLKTAMYRVLTEVTSISEQFKCAELKQGQRITIVQIGDFGSLIVSNVTLEKIEYGSYAQYDNAVKLIFKPKGKRNFYQKWLYRDMLLYNGWHEVPKNLLWDEIKGNTDGVTVRRTKFLSCDRKQYDVILEHFSKQGVMPIINTYKP